MAKDLLEIFDPPMCCASGLCGPDVDESLLAINESLLRLEQGHADRVEARRYLLNQTPAKFMSTPSVLTLLQDRGVEVLPITLLNGRVVKEAAYPTWDEIWSYLDGVVREP